MIAIKVPKAIMIDNVSNTLIVSPLKVRGENRLSDYLIDEL